MPATSASVERLFSVAGQVVTVKRARLHPSTVTLLVFLHEAIPGGIEREAYEIIEVVMIINWCVVLRVQCTLAQLHSWPCVFSP